MKNDWDKVAFYQAWKNHAERRETIESLCETLSITEDTAKLRCNSVRRILLRAGKSVPALRRRKALTKDGTTIALETYLLEE